MRHRVRKPRLSPRQCQLAASLLASGASTDAVAVEVGIPASSVLKLRGALSEPPAEPDGDLLEAAEHMILLGHKAAGLLACRVAIERALRDLAKAEGLSVPPRSSGNTLSEMLYHDGHIPIKVHRLNVGVVTRLNRIAHGESVRLFDAAKLVARTRERLEDLRRFGEAE